MAKRISIATAFNPSARTVDATGIAGLNPALVLVIINTTNDARGIIYDPITPNMGFAAVAGQVMTLQYDTGGQASGDTILIVWDDGESAGATASAPPVNANVMATSGGSRVLKTSPGSLVGFTCASNSAAWLLFYDAAVAPSDGTAHPLWFVPFVAGMASGRLGDAPLAFSTGLVAVFSSTGPTTQTSGPTGLLSAQVK